MEPTAPEPGPEATDQKPETTSTEGDAPAVNLGSLMDLSFGPEWARKPPSANYREGQGRFRPERPDRGGDRRDSGSFGRRDKPPMRGGDKRSSSPRPRYAERSEPAYEPPPPPVPANISLLPHQKALSSVIREISLSRKAFPVAEVASLFLNREDGCEVKIELHREAGDLSLYQCRICRLLSTDRSQIARHVQTDHIEDYFDKVETLTDPPAGQFSCVAKCGFTGTLLGPPNHHSYAENIRVLHAARFPEMPLETYTQAIQTVRDPALIDQWKEESRKQTVYRRKGQDPETEPHLHRAAAENWLLEHAVPEAIMKTRRAIMPKALSWNMRDRGLARAIKDAWNREKRYPASLLFALRGAFRHRNLHVFKAPDGPAYVTAVEPTPLAAEHVVDTIRDLFKVMEQHPRCKREDLVKALRPDIAPDSPEAAQLLTPLGWLVDKGHIIEFSNGTLSLPLPAEPRAVEEASEEPSEETPEETEAGAAETEPEVSVQEVIGKTAAKPGDTQGAANATAP